MYFVIAGGADSVSLGLTINCFAVACTVQYFSLRCYHTNHNFQLFAVPTSKGQRSKLFECRGYSAGLRLWRRFLFARVASLPYEAGRWHRP